MREMKNSGTEWLSDIPHDWTLSNIGSLYTMRNVKVSDRDYPPLSVTMKGVVPQLETAAKTDAHDDRKLVRKGDFAINSRSDRRGSCGIADRDGSVSLINTILAPRTKMNPDYYNWLFHSTSFADEFYRWGHGIVDDLWTTRWQEMKKIDVPVPSYEEQAQIASTLETECTKVDALIANQEAQIVKLKAYKQSIITEVVTKGLDPNVPMKDSGVEWIEKIPEGWNAVPLKTLFDFGKGLPITKENLVEEGIPVISYGQIHAKWNSGVTIHEELKRFVNKEYLETNPSCLVKKGDFIIADTSEDREGCGNAAYVDTDDTIFAGYHTVILISKKSNVDNKYLAYLFLTDAWRSQLRKRVSGIKVFSVSRKFLSETSVLIPDNALKMVELLDEKCSHIDKLISIKQEKIERLNQYKKSLIYEYVTGKKEVM